MLCKYCTDVAQHDGHDVLEGGAVDKTAVPESAGYPKGVPVSCGCGQVGLARQLEVMELELERGKEECHEYASERELRWARRSC